MNGLRADLPDIDLGAHHPHKDGRVLKPAPVACTATHSSPASAMDKQMHCLSCIGDDF